MTANNRLESAHVARLARKDEAPLLAVMHGFIRVKHEHRTR